MTTGRCLCGGVSYAVSGKLRDVSNCHCEHCRRLTGHHMAATAAERAQFTLTSDETLRWYSHQPDVEYGFCNRCGSTLFWRTATKPEHISITAGTLDHPTGLKTVTSLFDAEAGDYFDLPITPDSNPGDRTV